MKAQLVQIIGSSVLLGLMAGSVALHHAHVSGAQALEEGEAWGEVPAGDPIFAVADETTGMRVLPPAEGAEGGANLEVQTVAAMQLVLEELRDLRQENRSLRTQMQSQTAALRDQVSEFNRDISELEFRVDSHSESFRPLRARPEYRSRGNGQNLLLPPKP